MTEPQPTDLFTASVRAAQFSILTAQKGRVRMAWRNLRAARTEALRVEIEAKQ